MVDLIDVPCLINGAWQTSERTSVIADFQGVPRVRLHGASNAQVRMAKRAMLLARDELAATPLTVLIRIVKTASTHYFKDPSDYELTARLSGSPISYLYNSIEVLRQWLADIDKYLANVFGDANYEQVPILVGDVAAGYRKFLPTAPTVAVLPQNDDGVAAYVLAQLFLSKNPVLVKPSAHGGSAFATVRFIDALHTAIKLVCPERPGLLRAIQLINVLEDGSPRAEQVADLGLDGANFVLFGSDESVTTLANAILQKLTPRTVLRLGTGFSAAVILPDANLGLALNEVYESVIEDRGNKCTTTHALYVHERVYDQVIAEFRRLADVTHPLDPLDTRARIGRLDADTHASVAKRISDRFPRHAAKVAQHSPSFKFLEIEEHEPIEELPGPIVFVKKVSSIDHFCALLGQDRQRNKMDRNLATSVFTEDRNAVDALAARLPTHIVKWNVGTHAINFFIEHQSMFLMREVMAQTVVEYLNTRKAAQEHVAEAQRR